MTRQLSAEIEATAPAELQARERLPAVEAARAALEREVDDLRQNLRHRAAHVVELERHAGALAERAAALEQCVAALEQRVAELEQCVAELEGAGRGARAPAEGRHRETGRGPSSDRRDGGAPRRDPFQHLLEGDAADPVGGGEAAPREAAVVSPRPRRPLRGRASAPAAAGGA